MSIISGSVKSKSRKGTGIKIGDSGWINGKESQLRGIEWKDEVEAEIDADNQIVWIKKTKTAAPAAAGAKAVYNDDKKQRVIVFQSSRKDAIETAQALVASGAFTLPSAKAKQLDAYQELITKLTIEYHNEAMRVYEQEDNYIVDASEDD